MIKYFEKYKVELNKSFKELVKVDENKLVIDSFKKSQILWNKFIIEDCKFMNSPMSLTQGEGYIIVYYECLEGHYNTRIKQINKMVDYIK
ncbi:lysozyme inhibitor LprI family protein [Aggregatibacter aphrophilus]|uniref:lysozyme inhibitor LprI family protein n=1 Tax=Aggregatibacter aphrophilus TaxID=732 RepID=UPI003742A604